MIQRGTWRRRLGGLMVAMFAVLFLAGPMADSLICAGDDVPAAPAATSAGVFMISTDHHAAQRQHSEPAGVCQHGHAHSAAAFAETTQPCAAPIAVVAAAHHPQAIRLAIQRIPSGPERPPRA